MGELENRIIVSRLWIVLLPVIVAEVNTRRVTELLDTASGERYAS